ncbi:MAG: protein kinase [Thermoanaerobaculales bacterium]|nr:protein kinase [Thermoanaerobaculales bacterium]
MILDRVGRFTIKGRIGFGGMGDVFLAEDEKLGRTVAIKTLPHLMVGDHELETRLRNEAKTVARINHPSVAQIHDLISDGERHFLVLEHVEGANIGTLLSDGPMATDTVIRLAAEVADGLAAAHAQGVVHRDLKPENIMVTPAGRAKILDFGLATVRRQPEVEVPKGPQERPRLAGTLSAMSPEQVDGKTLEASSDLFSLGVLLYQMLTSSHPFRTSLPVETMQRIGSHDPPSPESLNCEIPPDLSRLTMRLLAKDPASRPQAAAEVASELRTILAARQTAETGVEAPTPPGVDRRRILAWSAIALVIAVAAGWWWLRSPQPDPFTVAILRPIVAGDTTDERISSVESGLRLAAVNALNTLEGAQVINTKEIDAISGDLRQITRAVAADELITMTLTPGTSTFSVEINRLSGEEGHMLWAARVEVPADNLRLLTDTVTANLELAYPDRRRRPGAFHVTAEPQAYEAFLVVWKRVMNPAADLSWSEALADLQQIRKSAPKLLNAAVLEASVARYLYETTKDDAYLKQAAKAIEAAKAVAPTDLRTLLAAAEVAVAAGDHRQAQGILNDLEKLEPANLAVAHQRARLAERMGKAHEAREILAAIVASRPSWKNLLNLARIEHLLGDIDGARTHLAEADRRAPSTLLIMVELAYLELMAGEPEHAEALFLQIVAVAPEPQHLANLGISQLLLHRFREALTSFERAYALGSRPPSTILNLADCHQLLGYPDLARKWYRNAIAAQPEDRPLFAGELEVKAQALAQLGRTSEALETIQEALNLDPDSPFILYAAALVYSIADRGDEARAYYELALEAGINYRWFDLPWFDGITPNHPPPSSPSPGATAPTAQ